MRWHGLTCVALISAGLIPALPDTAHASDHDIVLLEAKSIEAGSQASVSLTIAPAAGHRISKDAPLLVTVAVTEPAAVGLSKRRYQWRDAADAQATAPRFDLTVRGKAPGQGALIVTLRFWVCAKKTCRPVRAKRQVRISVVAPPPDAGPVEPDGGVAGPDA